ncbi:MAG TPA: hypothetical protein VNV61_11105 [Steroidobacteraceae bacterium]|jgi:hypothetical protein|nr:hypothetical protein [Steroidobacteraceae bacterium]
MNTRWKLAALAGIILYPALLIPRASLADEPAAASAPGVGVWQKHEYSFRFMGFTSTYSCDGLADKLKLLLIAAGARHDAKSQPGACASGFGRPDKFASATLTFYTLVPADSGTSPDAKTVGAVWRSVALTARSPRGLALGDCEVVEQFRNSVLPMFTTRNVESHLTCVPHQLSGSNIDLRFESLAAAPSAAHAAPVQPGGT